MFYNKCFPLLEELKVIEKNIFPAIINMILAVLNSKVKEVFLKLLSQSFL